MAIFWIVGIIFAIISGILCYGEAKRKGREPMKFFWIGILLPIVGIIITFIMPYEPGSENRVIDTDDREDNVKNIAVKSWYDDIPLSITRQNYLYTKNKQNEFINIGFRNNSDKTIIAIYGKINHLDEIFEPIEESTPIIFAIQDLKSKPGSEIVKNDIKLSNNYTRGIDIEIDKIIFEDGSMMLPDETRKNLTPFRKERFNLSPQLKNYIKSKISANPPYCVPNTQDEDNWLCICGETNDSSLCKGCKGSFNLIAGWGTSEAIEKDMSIDRENKLRSEIEENKKRRAEFLDNLRKKLYMGIQFARRHYKKIIIGVITVSVLAAGSGYLYHIHLEKEEKIQREANRKEAIKILSEPYRYEENGYRKLNDSLKYLRRDSDLWRGSDLSCSVKVIDYDEVKSLLMSNDELFDLLFEENGKNGIILNSTQNDIFIMTCLTVDKYPEKPFLKIYGEVISRKDGKIIDRFDAPLDLRSKDIKTRNGKFIISFEESTYGDSLDDYVVNLKDISKEQTYGNYYMDVTYRNDYYIE